MKLRSSAGYSLVELVVAAGVIGVLLLFGSRFFKQADDGRAAGKARSDAQRINTQLQGLIERDLHFRVSDTSFTVSADQKVLTLKRRQALDVADLASSDDDYEVIFATVCRPVPAQLSGYKDLSVQLAGQNFAKIGSCLKAVKCGTGELPRVEVTVPNTGRIPSYPNTIFPTESGITRSFRQHAVASAVCFQASANQIRITVDSVYPVSKDQYSALSQDKSVSLKSADFKLLPQENQP